MKKGLYLALLGCIFLFVGCGSDSQNESSNAENKLVFDLSYDGESLQKSFTEYAYYENPYYLEGLNRYIESINAIYEKEGAGQKVEIISVEDAMEMADISNKFQKSFLEIEGTNVLQNNDVVLLEEKGAGFSITELLDSDVEKGYFELSSKPKGSESWGEIFYYYGKLKDNKPDGEGVLLKVTETGIRPSYIGEFEEGKLSGNGVMLLPEKFGAVISSVAEHEKNVRTGNSILYDTLSVANDFNTYVLAFDEYNNEHLINYEASKQNSIMDNLMENSPVVELMTAVAGYYDESETNVIKVKYPVIKAFISYEGELKQDKYHGKGCLYDGLGLALYEGEFSKGKFHGDGVLYYVYPDEIKYEGGFKHGKYDGKGTLYNKDGSVRKDGKFDEEDILSGFEFGMVDMSSEFISLSDIVTKAWYEKGSKALFEDLLNEEILNESADEEIIEGDFEDALYYDAWNLVDIGSWYSDEIGYYMIPFVDDFGNPSMAISVENNLFEYAIVYYIDCVQAKEVDGKLTYKGKLYEASDDMPQIGAIEAVWDSLETVSIKVTEGDQSVASDYTYYGPMEY